MNSSPSCASTHFQSRFRYFVICFECVSYISLEMVSHSVSAIFSLKYMFSMLCVSFYVSEFVFSKNPRHIWYQPVQHVPSLVSLNCTQRISNYLITFYGCSSYKYFRITSVFLFTLLNTNVNKVGIWNLYRLQGNSGIRHRHANSFDWSHKSIGFWMTKTNAIILLKHDHSGIHIGIHFVKVSVIHRLFVFRVSADNLTSTNKQLLWQFVL